MPFHRLLYGFLLARPFYIHSKIPTTSNQSSCWFLFKPQHKKFKLRRIALVVIVLLIMRLCKPAMAKWNTTVCPSMCQCESRMSEVSHTTMLNTVSCISQQFKSAPSNIPADTEALLLSANELGDIDDFILKLRELQELDLSSNKFHSLGRDDIFNNLSELVYLNLAKNELTSIIRDVFNGLIQLKVLILSENKIAYIYPQAFEGLTALTTLNLGKNSLSSVDPEMFYGLLRLKELHLYENKIRLINSATFRSLIRLEHLSLYGNRIKTIASDGFWGLDSLTALFLEKNNIEEVPLGALRRLPSLQVLRLNGNAFSCFKTGDFSSLKIEELTLNNQPYLKMIEPEAFFNLTHLTKLEIRDCPKLAYIDANAFVNLTVLGHLNLQNNRLSSVPQKLFYVLQAGGEIALKGNPFVCDCNVRWMRKEMEMEAARNRSFIEKDQLLCKEPEYTRGAQIQHLDLNSVLTSQCSPSILNLMEPEVERALGKPLNLDCRAQGIPSPKVTWKLPAGHSLDNTGNRSSNHVRFQMRRSGTLYFSHLKEEDIGNYTCVAENTLGTDEFTVAVKVRKIDIQLFPIGISSTFVTLVWNGTARASYPKYKILYRPLNPELIQPTTALDTSSANCGDNYKCVTVSPVHHSYDIGSLQPDSKYEFCLSIDDADGYYIHVSCTTVKTQDINYMLQGIHRVSNVAIAVVLGIIVTMVMVICVVTVAAKKYRHRQYVCPDKHPIHRMPNIPMENLYCPLMSNASPY
ncbi:Leucine-rich repeat neuronal protein 1 [Chamberlinius hualienensis]